MAKTIGVLGSGSVGQTLAGGFAQHGYGVTIGSNSAAKREELQKKLGGTVKVGSFEDAARFGDLVVLAVKGSAAEGVVTGAVRGHLAGKTVIDTTNPIADLPPVNGVITLSTKPGESLLERLQTTVPDAHFVKAFSCIGSSLMVNPRLKEGKPSMFICGNHDGAKGEVRAILVQFGFDVEDMGKMEAARAIEPLCVLWCIPGFLQNDWVHGFRLLKQ